MTTDTIAIIIIIGLGLVLGYRTAASSKKREALHGGALSELFHYLASICLTILAPSVLTGVLILHLPFVQLLILAFGIFGLGIVFSLLHAIFEKPAIAAATANNDDTGWTEEDARTSGL